MSRHRLPQLPAQLNLPLCLGAAILMSGCRAPGVRLQDLSSHESVLVVLDANARAVQPGRRIKFFVDLSNTTEKTLALGDVSVELLVSPRRNPSTVALRKTWTYRWNEHLALAPGRRVTLPIVPECRTTTGPPLGKSRRDQALRVSEFPVAELSPGRYDIRACVNGRFSSKPYELVVHRPDLLRYRQPRRTAYRSSSR